MTRKQKEPVGKATLPSAKTLFYYNWATEFPKENIQILNEHLNRFLIFSGGLFSIVTFFKTNIDPRWLPFIMGFLLVSIMISFIGNLPVEQFYKQNRPDTIEAAIRYITKQKKLYIILSFSFIFASMCLILLSVIYKSYWITE